MSLVSRFDTFAARRAAWLIGIGLAIVTSIALAIAMMGFASIDFHSYYVVNASEPYIEAPVGALDAFWYSPAAAMAFAAFRILPFEVAATVFRVINLAALVWLAGPVTAVVVWALPVALVLSYANIEILLAAAIVAGFRWPGTWAMVLLTKPSCGIALLYFALRREWRQFGIALGTTLAIAGVSFVINPGSWATYISTLVSASAAGTPAGIPLGPRVILALAVVVAGAWRKWQPSVVIAAWLALPVWWPQAPALLVGLLYWAPWRRPPVRREAIQPIGYATPLQSPG
jgi:hypothetical protein